MNKAAYNFDFNLRIKEKYGKCNRAKELWAKKGSILIKNWDIYICLVKVKNSKEENK